MRGLEARRRSEIVRCGIDLLAARDGRRDVRRSVPKAERTHRDERTIVGQKCDAKVQLQHTIGTLQQPVGAPFRYDDAAKTWPVEVPAVEGHGSAGAMWNAADNLRRRNVYTECHQQTRVHP